MRLALQTSNARCSYRPIIHHSGLSVRDAVVIESQSPTHPILTEKPAGIPIKSPYPQSRLIGSGRPKPFAILEFKVGHVTELCVL